MPSENEAQEQFEKLMVAELGSDSIRKTPVHGEWKYERFMVRIAWKAFEAGRLHEKGAKK